MRKSTNEGDIEIMSNMSQEGEVLSLRNTHIEGPGAGSLGLKQVRSLARTLGKQFNAKVVKIYGGIRTTGANPGKTPRPITIKIR